MYLPTQNYTPKQWQRVQSMLDHVYGDFVTKAAEGRDLSMDSVRQIAQGRVWTGRQALSLGLVDTLGGLSVAITLAKREAGIPADDPVRLETFPPERNFLDYLLSGNARSERRDAKGMDPRTATLLRKVGRVVEEVGGSSANESRILYCPIVGHMK